MENSFNENVFVIAGGSKGIGLELVRRLASDGGTVHVYSRTTGDLNSEDQAMHHACDFGKDQLDSSALPEQIQGVAYCPGTINLRSFRGLKLDDFRSDFEINLMGAVKFLKACLPGLIRGGGTRPTSVVLFSTVAVGRGLSMHASVAAAKGAVEGLTRSLAAEWAPRIRVNCLAPALTETPLTESFFSTDKKRAEMAAKYPLGRAGRPKDMASMAQFLLCPENSWITGQIIGVDGGMANLGT
jgi:NAD(P)-dependent dehydrogenase (short-subunit alcohol dehydrogenase family)